MKSIGSAIGGIVLLSSPASLAAEEFLVELVGSPNELPAVVCLASREPQFRAGTPRPAFMRSWRQTSTVLGPPSNPTEPDKRSDKWRFSPKPAASTDAPIDANDLALAHLRRAPDPNVAFADTDRCAPRVELPVDHKIIWCQRNGLAPADASGVVVLSVEFGVSEAPPIDPFTVDGNLLTIRLQQNARSTPSVRVAGGHYRVTSVSPAAGKSVKMALEPVCYTRRIRLPDLETQSAARVGVRYADPADTWQRFVPTSAGHVLVALPPSPQASEPKLTLSAQWTYEVQWNEETPPKELPLLVKAFGFEWVMPCEYPLDGCPLARLDEIGEQATGLFTSYSNDALQPSEVDRGARGVCSYHITAATPVRLPMDVSFVTSSLPTWRSRLTRAGQKLHDYLEAGNRLFQLKMPWSSQVSSAPDEIQYVEIIGPTGTRHVIRPQAASLINLPFSGCGEQISYRLHGDREFEWDSVPIKQGVITLPSPGVQAEVAELGVQLGGGFMVDDDGHSRPYGQAELSVRLRPKRWGESAFPWVLRKADYEIALSYLLATQPYTPLHTADNQEDSTQLSVPYNRFSLGAYALWPLGKGVFLGPGASFGIGYALLKEDSDRVGEARFFVMPAPLRVHYDLSRRISLVATVRLIPADRLYAHSTPNDFRGTPEAASESVWWPLFDAGLQGWL
jgi:hypothetical protein